jgi:hypothetical protein
VDINQRRVMKSKKDDHMSEYDRTTTNIVKIAALITIVSFSVVFGSWISRPSPEPVITVVKKEIDGTHYALISIDDKEYLGKINTDGRTWGWRNITDKADTGMFPNPFAIDCPELREIFNNWVAQECARRIKEGN